MGSASFVQDGCGGSVADTLSGRHPTTTVADRLFVVARENPARFEVDPVRRTGWLCGDAVAAAVVQVFVFDGAAVVDGRV